MHDDMSERLTKINADKYDFQDINLRSVADIFMLLIVFLGLSIVLLLSEYLIMQIF